MREARCLSTVLGCFQHDFPSDWYRHCLTQRLPFLTQIRLALGSIDACLRHAGANAGQVVKVTIFMTDISERAAINPLRIEYFGENRPASTLVEVSQLVDPAFKVEIEVVAFVDA